MLNEEDVIKSSWSLGINQGFLSILNEIKPADVVSDLCLSKDIYYQVITVGPDEFYEDIVITSWLLYELSKSQDKKFELMVHSLRDNWKNIEKKKDQTYVTHGEVIKFSKRIVTLRDNLGNECSIELDQILKAAPKGELATKKNIDLIKKYHKYFFTISGFTTFFGQVLTNKAHNSSFYLKSIALTGTVTNYKLDNGFIFCNNLEGKSFQVLLDSVACMIFSDNETGQHNQLDHIEALTRFKKKYRDLK